MAAVPENVLKKTRRAEEWAAQKAAQAQEVSDIDVCKVVDLDP